MSPQLPINPLTAPLAMIKQVGEQANLSLQSIGTGMAQATSQGLDTLMAAAPPVPGVPGAPAPTRVAGFPTPQQLLPGNLAQALGQVENLLIPPGMPRPSQVLAGQQPPAPAPAPSPAPAPAPPMVSRKRVAERRGL